MVTLTDGRTVSERVGTVRGTAANRFDEVIAATKTVVDGVLDKAKAVKAGEPIRLKDYRVTGDILGLALRANVQKGDVVKGKAILEQRSLQSCGRGVAGRDCTCAKPLPPALQIVLRSRKQAANPFHAQQ